MYRVDDLAVLRDIKEGRIRIGLGEYAVVKSNIMDYLETINRKAQIIGPKDASYIIFHCGIRAGSTVVEGGVGSGALTMALLYFTYPGGHVFTYEKRKDFAEFARRNVQRGEYSHWTLKIGDVTRDVSERDVDAYILDIPEPWLGVDMAIKALRSGGCFAAYVPTYNQLERTYKDLKKSGFIELKAVEIIMRGIHVGPLGTRPENIEVAHTGFIVFGRKV